MSHTASVARRYAQFCGLNMEVAVDTDFGFGLSGDTNSFSNNNHLNNMGNKHHPKKHKVSHYHINILNR
jgi:hypothetical protein